MDDPHDLARFVTAQAPVYDQVRDELRRGRKASHWMWFVFPQIAGLGHSAMAQRYAVASLDEARAYLDHPILGPRLREAAALVTAVDGKSLNAILGSPDDLKFHSSMTLFSVASGNELVFARALDKYFTGEPDPATLTLLTRPSG
jgi:uncharacterized protein (DUF1810 family)